MQCPRCEVKRNEHPLARECPLPSSGGWTPWQLALCDRLVRCLQQKASRVPQLLRRQPDRPDRRANLGGYISHVPFRGISRDAMWTASRRTCTAHGPKYPSHVSSSISLTHGATCGPMHIISDSCTTTRSPSCCWRHRKRGEHPVDESAAGCGGPGGTN